VLLDCSGWFAPTKPGALAGASLPLVERGARPGGAPGELDDARVAGRVIELVPACTELTYFHRLIAETRWLVEAEGADVVVGSLGTSEGVVMRQLAAKYPDVTFLLGSGIAQEATLGPPLENLFRYTADGGQTVAGLGSYAYDELGWRRAVVVAEGYPGGFELGAGFIAEFCALGGAVVERDYLSLYQPDQGAAAGRHARAADGVALLSTFVTPSRYLREYAAAVGSGLERRLVAAGSAFTDSANLAPAGTDTTGVVVAAPVPLDPDDEAMRSYRASFRKAFPSLPQLLATLETTLAAYAAMEAVASALERTEGELGAGQRELRRALAGLELDLPQGPVRLDRNRQAINRVPLARIVRTGTGRVELDTIRVVEGVDQTFGGLFSGATAPPSWTTPACKRGSPPPWAR
jgi:branched-chain amino acid transport system substrate-binding protein